MGPSTPENRIKKTPRRSEIHTIIRGGQRTHNAHFTAIWATTSIKNGEPKLRLTIGADAGSSVVRTHAKRVIREVFRHTQAQLLKGTAVVILARANLTSLTRSELHSSLEVLFERLIKSQNCSTPPTFRRPPRASFEGNLSSP